MKLCILRKGSPDRYPKTNVPESNDRMFPPPGVLKSLPLRAHPVPGADPLGSLCPGCVLGRLQRLFISGMHLIREACLTSSLHINLIS